MIPPGPASHTHDAMARQRDREIRLVQARDAAIKRAEAAEKKVDEVCDLYAELTGESGEHFDAANAARAKLAAIDALHQPDPDNNHACQCGLTRPCPTRRALDGGTNP